jgi:hypothetical protein
LLGSIHPPHRERIDRHERLGNAMAPTGLPVAAVVAALWVLVASHHRSSFGPLLARRPAPEAPRAARSNLTPSAATLARA